MKGNLVLIKWVDIVADLHSEECIEPALAESVGWVESKTKKYIRLLTSRYKDDTKLADRIVIPMGCVEEIVYLGKKI
jgi:hypothetical protein|tara:strand:+ start:2747 stop:2977 length:231 start_codon:yes stop_codon:yes gene_type:complete